MLTHSNTKYKASKLSVYTSYRYFHRNILVEAMCKLYTITSSWRESVHEEDIRQSLQSEVCRHAYVLNR